MSVKTAAEAIGVVSEAEIAFLPEAAFLAKRVSFLPRRRFTLMTLRSF